MQASNLDQLGSGLLSVLQNGLQQAVEQAAQHPDRFSQIISNATQEVAPIPDELWQKIRESAEKPDWLGLMLFLAVQIRDAVKDPRLTVGTYNPGDNWSPALILIYTLDEASFSLSIALGGDDINGFIIETKNAPNFKKPANPLVFDLQAKGDHGKWHFPLNASGSGPAGATITFNVSLAQPILPVGNDTGIGSLSIGIPRIEVTAEGGTDNALKWKVDLSFGTKAEPGLQAKLDPAGFLGDLATIVQIQTINEQYSPKLSFSSQHSPIFDIGHQST